MAITIRERLLRRVPRARAIAWDLVFWLRRDHSQHGEQALLSAVLPPCGSYLEIGCHQPVKCSNTYLLYRRGWRGWTIDAHDYAWLWRIFRPNDVFIVSAVTAEQGMKSITFYDFDQNATLVSTVVKAHADDWEARGFSYVARQVPATDMRTVYAEFVLSLGTPTLLAVDVEGLDYDLMASIEPELNAHDRPAYLLVEDLAGMHWAPLLPGYEQIGTAGPSILFRSTSQLQGR